MAIVLVTMIESGRMGETTRIECANLAEANKVADRFERPGCVGCVKIGDKIKRVF